MPFVNFFYAVFTTVVISLDKQIFASVFFCVCRSVRVHVRVCVCVCVCDTLFMGMAAGVMYMML